VFLTHPLLPAFLSSAPLPPSVGPLFCRSSGLIIFCDLSIWAASFKTFVFLLDSRSPVAYRWPLGRPASFIPLHDFHVVFSFVLFGPFLHFLNDIWALPPNSYLSTFPSPLDSVSFGRRKTSSSVSSPGRGSGLHGPLLTAFLTF